MILRARQFEFYFPRPVMIMGVVNVTPDSFSDGGRFLDAAAAIEHALALAGEGVDLIDIGGESTRPNAVPVDEAEELRRVIPVIKELAAVSKIPLPLSIDTMKPSVAKAAIDSGAAIVNDVAANRADPAMWRIVAETGAGYVVMHMQGTPQTMQRNPTYRNVMTEVGEFFSERLIQLREHGVKEEQTILDVGIGFGKNLEHNLELLAGLGHFRRNKRPVMVGASRKAFIGKVTGARGPEERLPGSLVCACVAAEAGVEIIRTHDVSATRQALRMVEAIQSKRK